MSEVVWIADYWPEIDADYLTFYHIDIEERIDELDVPLFIRRALRLFAYEGALQAKYRKDTEDHDPARKAKAQGATVVGDVSDMGNMKGMDGLIEMN